MKSTTLLIGYARISKGDDQSTALQLRALNDAGCDRIFEEAASGGRWDRPELHRMIDYLRCGDVIENVSTGRKTAAQMARFYGVSEPTISRIIAAARQKIS